MSRERGDLAPLLHKLRRHAPLDQDDAAALTALPHRLVELRPLGHVVREGDTPPEGGVLLSGIAFSHRIAGDGGRQICTLHVPGDLIDMSGAFLAMSDSSTQALTTIVIAMVPADALRDLGARHPRIAEAMLLDALVEASIAREWTLNVGRRNARTRIAHILLEFGVRLKAAGLGDDTAYQLPLTQEQLADCTGLTSVHINRTLKQLETEGLIARSKRAIAIPDVERLRLVGDFDPRYLHLPARAGATVTGPAR